MYAYCRCGNRKSNHVDYGRVHISIGKKKLVPTKSSNNKKECRKSNNDGDTLTRIVGIIKITLE